MVAAASVGIDVEVTFAAPDQGAERQLRVNDAMVHSAPEYTAIAPKLLVVGTSRCDVATNARSPNGGDLCRFLRPVTFLVSPASFSACVRFTVLPRAFLLKFSAKST